MFSLVQRVNRRLQKLALQHIEIARGTEDLAEPADRFAERLDALAAQQRPVNPDRGPKPPQRDPALMNTFDMQIEPRAVVVGGEVSERIENDEPEQLARGHLRTKAQLRRA